MVNLLYNIVDRIYIGQIPGEGALALTGMGVTFPVITLISAFAALIGMGGSPRASIAMGAGEHEKAERTLGTCTAALWALAIVLTVLFLLFQEPLLVLFGASADTLPYALQYSEHLCAGHDLCHDRARPQRLYHRAGQIRRGDENRADRRGAQRRARPGVHLRVRHGRARRRDRDRHFAGGLRGVGGQVPAGDKSTLRLRRRFLRLDSKLLLPAVALGASPFVMQATESLLTVTFNVSLQKYGGDLAVGAMTILTSVAQMVQMPLMGLAQGAQPILSFNYGAGRPDRMKQSVRYTLVIACVFAFAVWGLVQLAPHAVAQLFNRSTELVDITAWALRIYFAVGFTMAFQNTFQQSFVALGEAKISLFLALERKVILLIPLILILPHFMPDKLFAVFFAEPVADFLAAATTTTLFLIRFRHILRDMEQKSQS